MQNDILHGDAGRAVVPLQNRRGDLAMQRKAFVDAHFATAFVLQSQSRPDGIPQLPQEFVVAGIENGTMKRDIRLVVGLLRAEVGFHSCAAGGNGGLLFGRPANSSERRARRLHDQAHLT